MGDDFTGLVTFKCALKDESDFGRSYQIENDRKNILGEKNIWTDRHFHAILTMVSEMKNHSQPALFP